MQITFYEEERDIMAKATSEWITQLHFAFQDAQNLYLVMEFHGGGDLLSLLSRFVSDIKRNPHDNGVTGFKRQQLILI